jgi:hypothetical protein
LYFFKIVYFQILEKKLLLILRRFLKKYFRIHKKSVGKPCLKKPDRSIVKMSSVMGALNFVHKRKALFPNVGSEYMVEVGRRTFAVCCFNGRVEVCFIHAQNGLHNIFIF